jgi:hypothetical protein
MAWHLTLIGYPAEPVLTYLTLAMLPLLLNVHCMEILEFLSFLPTASTKSFGWYALTGNFPLG